MFTIDFNRLIPKVAGNESVLKSMVFMTFVW